MKTLNLVFKFDRETKDNESIRYYEEGLSQSIGSLYVKKKAFAGLNGWPRKLKVVIEGINEEVWTPRPRRL